MSIYSFLIAVRSDGQQLMSDTGETTSHLMGMFYRTLRMVENGIKPLYVFDGAPPKLKSGELAKRFQRKQEATEGMEEAKETGTAEDVEKFSRRTVRVTREHNAECQRLLKLMGVPYIVAPTEAEAQCAVLAKAGKVYAAASEDMDTLTFDTPILLRHLTFSEQRKEPIQEIRLDKVLEGLNMERKQVCGPGTDTQFYNAVANSTRPVRGSLHPPWLRLSRPSSQGRTYHSSQAHPRTRQPRKGSGGHRERPEEEVRHPRRLALRRRAHAVLRAGRAGRRRPAVRLQVGEAGHGRPGDVSGDGEGLLGGPGAQRRGAAGEESQVIAAGAAGRVLQAGGQDGRGEGGAQAQAGREERREEEEAEAGEEGQGGVQGATKRDCLRRGRGGKTTFMMLITPKRKGQQGQRTGTRRDETFTDRR